MGCLSIPVSIIQIRLLTRLLIVTLLFSWESGARTISYLDRSNSGWFAGSLSPFFDHGIENGWFTEDQYLNSVMAGWEFGHGYYFAEEWGAVGF